MINRRHFFGLGAGLAAAVSLDKLLPAHSENSLQHAGIADPQTSVRAASWNRIPMRYRYVNDTIPRRYDSLFRTTDGGVEQIGVDLKERNDDLARRKIKSHALSRSDITHPLPLDVDYDVGAYRWRACDPVIIV